MKHYIDIDGNNTQSVREYAQICWKKSRESRYLVNHLWTYSEASFILRCKSMTEQARFDDTELEEEGIAEQLLDDNSMASVPRFVSFVSLFGDL